MKSPDIDELLKKALFTYKPNSYWKRLPLDIGRAFFFVAVIVGILFVFGRANLLEWSLIVSLLVAEIPIGWVIAGILREGRNSRTQRGLDAVEIVNANIRFAHLAVFNVDDWEDYEYPRLQYFVVNMNTKKGYKAEKWIDELLNSTIITHQSKFRNKDELMEDLRKREITLLDRFPSYAELGLV